MIVGRAKLLTIVESLFREERPVLPVTKQQLQTEGLGEKAQLVTTLDTSTKFSQVNMLQYFKSKVDCFKQEG